MKNFDKNEKRDDARIKQTGEVFTPNELVLKMLSEIPDNQFSDAKSTFLDPTCGNGQFLVQVKLRIMEKNPTMEEKYILENMIFGVDLMLDNVKMCIYRLCVDGNAITIPGYEKDFAKAPMKVINPNGYKMNICCADGLQYDYEFIRYNGKKHQAIAKSLCGQFYLEYQDIAQTAVDNPDLFTW